MRNAKELQAKSRTHRVTELATGIYDVESGDSGAVYRVCVHQGAAICSCEWGKYRPRGDRRVACSHVLAVLNWLAQREGQRTYAWATPGDAARQHKRTEDIGDGVLVTTSQK